MLKGDSSVKFRFSFVVVDAVKVLEDVEEPGHIVYPWRG